MLLVGKSKMTLEERHHTWERGNPIHEYLESGMSRECVLVKIVDER